MAFQLAIPSDGALHEPALAFLRSCGLGVLRTNSRRYTAEIPSLSQASALFQRAADIPARVDEGAAEAGVVGLDRFHESLRDGGSTTLVFSGLGFGHCDLVLGVPESWVDVTSLADLSDLSIEFRETVGDLRIATRYPRLVSSFLLKNGITHFSLVQTGGALEAMPATGMSDIIADISETGTTLRENRLKTISGGMIFSSQACLIANVKALRSDERKMESAIALVERIEGHLNSADFYSLTANLRGETAEEVASYVLRHADISGISGPTIARVYTPSEGGWYAVTIVVEKDRLLSAVDLLRQIGGTGITVSHPDYVFQAESKARSLLTRNGNEAPSA